MASPKGEVENGDRAPVAAAESKGSPGDGDATVSKSKAYTISVILFCVNILNYIDRYTIAGVLTSIQNYYSINNALAGLLSTVFVVFLMCFSPLFGFLGDRYSRKRIIIAGMIIWIVTVFASTFIPANLFWLFALSRGIVGIGQASFTVISPSVIGDLFSGDARSRMLMFLYLAIPFGSGLGFIISSTVAAFAGDWHWGVRVTAPFGILFIVLVIVLTVDPERGSADDKDPHHGHAKAGHTGFLEDLWSLIKNHTYMFSLAAYTLIVFASGTIAWWFPSALEHHFAGQYGYNSTDMLEKSEKARVNLIFGAITCIGGIVGVILGTLLSELIRNGRGPFRLVQTERSDPIVCGLGALIAAPSLFIALRTSHYKMVLAWTFLFICITAACFNWATNVNMVLSVVVPYQRNAATACQVAISHLFGDSFGPYLLGLVSDAIRGGDESPAANFHSLEISFYIPDVFLFISSLLFFAAAFTFIRDRRRFQERMGQQPKENESPREAAGIGLSALKGSQTVQDGDGESNSQRSGSYSQPDGDATSATKEDSKTTLGSRENEEG
ncbi:hypothetical protein Q1695_002153 [Nippostrongylus brasiliensis]|nr:hypothetical protein Q1695_002153 [Nippostrongylus brasiliensis]